MAQPCPKWTFRTLALRLLQASFDQIGLDMAVRIAVMEATDLWNGNNLPHSRPLHLPMICPCRKLHLGVSASISTTESLYVHVERLLSSLRPRPVLF
jgi:hypothetical protein